MEVPLGTNLLGSLIEYIRTSEPQVSKQDTGTRGGGGGSWPTTPRIWKLGMYPPQYLSSWPVIKCLQKQKEKSWSLTKHNYSFLYYFWGFHLPPPPPRCLTDGFSLDLHVLLWAHMTHSERKARQIYRSRGTYSSKTIVLKQQPQQRVGFLLYGYFMKTQKQYLRNNSLCLWWSVCGQNNTFHLTKAPTPT